MDEGVRARTSTGDARADRVEGADRDGGGLGGAGERAGAGDGAHVRVRLDLAYDGTAFRGWAAQPGLRTVEGELTAAISTVVRTPVVLTVAGRTDAGVHARHQVAHVDVATDAWQVLGASRGHQGRAVEELLVARLNGLLARGASLSGTGGQRGSSDVVVARARVVTTDFDARFSALGRHYCYRISDSLASRDPMRRRDVWWLDRGPLDVAAMGASASALLGGHDFLSYCKPREGATTIRTLRELAVRRVDWAGGASDAGRQACDGSGDAGTGDAGREACGGRGPLEVAVSADAFCHSMVRSLVGALVEVGLGRRAVDWPAQLLQTPSRQAAAPLAPACGLTLEGVDYPSQGEWAARARLARRRRDGGCC